MASPRGFRGVLAAMICYASRTGTRRNLSALREAGWRLLVSRTGVWRTEGFRYCLDSGAWSDFQANRPFDEDAYERMAERLGSDCDFLVLPDIVAGGLPSLDFSVRWLNRGLSLAPIVLIAVQDGMTEADLAPFVGRNVGIFLGGSTDWKLATMASWGKFCANKECHYHVARVNTRKRMIMANAAGASSVDGSSVTRFAKTITHLSNSARQQDFFSPRAA